MIRPPVIAILGHVDHGKTTLLDYIRKSNIIAKEQGGITQTIGAYEITTDIRGYHISKLTFIDTPGHEAFIKLRARGADVADIVFLIVDAKDSVMQQTTESIAHIKAANIPLIVVANKIDLPEANVEKVKIDLMKHEIIVEDKGGNVPFMSVSAKTGRGVKELLEASLLLASELNLSYDPSNEPKAYIIETKKDKRGIVIHAVIKDGKLSVGDTIYCDGHKIRVRSLIDGSGARLTTVQPSSPFELLGFEKFPEVGSLIMTSPAVQKKEEIPQTTPKKFDLESILASDDKKQQLSVIIKTDVHGSLEAINHALEKNQNVKIILSSVGEITKSDIFLAKTTRSIIIGFNLKPSSEIVDISKHEKVVIKTYNIIYELIDELVEVSDIIKEKEEREKNAKGEAKVAAVFIIDKEKVFGVKITKGKANIDDPIEIYRDKKSIGKSKLVSLKQRAKSVQEVKKDQEAGMMFAPELDLKVGDVIKFIL